MKAHESMDARARAMAADYVLDTLDPAERREFEVHMEGCDLCRAEVAALGGLVETLSEPAPESAPRPELWSRIQERLGFAGAEESQGTEGGSQQVKQPTRPDFCFDESSGWLPAPIPGVVTRILKIDEHQDRVTFEALLQPGASYPVHDHAGPEECYVISGDLWVGDVQMHAGDYQSLEGGSVHAAQSTDKGCRILLIAPRVNSPLAWA